MRHIFVNRKLAKSEKVQKELRESSRGPSATLVQRLLRIERRKKDQYVLKEERLSTYSFIARDIFVDDVDEEEVESDEVVDGQF
jgi:hypothetical protein